MSENNADPEKASTFGDLGVSDEIVAILAAKGITEPFPVQVMTIPDALVGRESVGRPRRARGRRLPSASPWFIGPLSLSQDTPDLWFLSQHVSCAAR